MRYQHENKYNKELYKDLRVECDKCFGLCCVSLYFSTSQGFPKDKEAGEPCLNLQSDFRCSIHKNLRNQGLKGCTAYDCFGAGQKVAQVTYGGRDWKQVPELANQMFEVFLIMRQLHEMLWYLAEALILQQGHPIRDELNSMFKETECVTRLSPDSLMRLDVSEHRVKVNKLLMHTSEHMRTKGNVDKNISSKNKNASVGRLDYIGSDLRKTNLRGSNLRGALLIAADLRGTDLSGADLIGADLRDADIRGTNLAHSMFLTQTQINVAKGDSNTKLPMFLVRPTYWQK